MTDPYYTRKEIEAHIAFLAETWEHGKTFVEQVDCGSIPRESACCRYSVEFRDDQWDDTIAIIRQLLADNAFLAAELSKPRDRSAF